MKLGNNYSILLTLIAGLGFGACTSARAGSTFLYLEPAQYHATLVTFNKNQIPDNTFAQLTASALIKNGQRNIHDADFFFAECFSGGMLDDLIGSLGNKVPWVGGSASAWFRPSEGFQFAPNRWDSSWTNGTNGNNGLLGQLFFGPNQPLLTSLQKAAANDPFGPREIPQFLSANGGNTLTLADPAVTAAGGVHRAVIWVGDTTFSGGDNPFVNVINSLLASMKKAWAGSNFRIDILFGDGKNDTLGNPLPAAYNDGTHTFLHQGNRAARTTRMTKRCHFRPARGGNTG